MDEQYINVHCDACGAPTNRFLSECSYCDTPYSKVRQYIGPEIKKDKTSLNRSWSISAQSAAYATLNTIDYLLPGIRRK